MVHGAGGKRFRIGCPLLHLGLVFDHLLLQLNGIGRLAHALIGRQRLHGLRRLAQGVDPLGDHHGRQLVQLDLTQVRQDVLVQLMAQVGSVDGAGGRDDVLLHPDIGEFLHGELRG